MGGARRPSPTGDKWAGQTRKSGEDVSFILATKSTKNTKMDLFESPVTPLGNEEIRVFVIFVIFVLFVAKNSSLRRAAHG